VTSISSPPGRLAPDWLVRPDPALCPCGCLGRRRKTSFVAKTLDGTSKLVRQAMFADDVAASRGLLQRVDPRVKLVTFVGLLVTAAFVRSIPALAALYLVTLVLAALSGLSVGFFVKRVWLFVPLFTGIVVLPATLNVVTSGHIVVRLGTWFGHELGVTSEGLHAAGLIVLRVATSISIVVLLTLTTPWHQVLAALRSLFVPKMFVLVLAMAYRYVFHLLTAVTDMYTARRSRTAGSDRDAVPGRRFVAASAGALFGKAHTVSEEVYLAMVSRGYTGEVRTLRRARLGVVDAAWIVVTVMLALSLLGLDRLVA
jgi:cobalt/nickel transport system permease protein